MKKVLILIIVFLFLFVYPLGNFSSLVREDFSVEVQTKEGIEYLAELRDVDVNKAEEVIIAAEEIRNYVPKSKKQLVKETLEKLEKGETTYKKVFRDTYIMGDSLMNGLESYGILNKKKIISQVSATFEHLKANYKAVIEKKPEILILHYGVNMLGFEEASLIGFENTYKKYVKKLKKALPGTRIILSSIFPVDRKVASAKRFGRIKVYNKTIKKVAEDTGVEYLNNAPVLKSVKEYCYGRDGIHFPESFYRDYWLLYVIEEMEIY